MAFRASKPLSEKPFESWEEFEKEILQIQKEKQELIQRESMGYVSPLLFRGHSDATWKLETTLERYVQEKSLDRDIYRRDSYYRVIQIIDTAFSSFWDHHCDVSDALTRVNRDTPPGYPFMIYLRHHGFPSPLLDWTESPYVAAFFAFKDARSDKEVAIYTFRQDLGEGHGGWVERPCIHNLGPTVRTHKRHSQQQSQYTICHKKVKDCYFYCPHEEGNFEENQNKLFKYTIPGSERAKVMEKLSVMNINAFSLFGNEEGLANKLAYDYIEKRQGF